MLAKVTGENQVTLPHEVARLFDGVDSFEVSTDGNSITLKPLRPSSADEVRERLARLGIREQDIEDAVKWARSGE